MEIAPRFNPEDLRDDQDSLPSDKEKKKRIEADKQRVWERMFRSEDAQEKEVAESLPDKIEAEAEPDAVPETAKETEPEPRVEVAAEADDSVVVVAEADVADVRRTESEPEPEPTEDEPVVVDVEPRITAETEAQDIAKNSEALAEAAAAVLEDERRSAVLEEQRAAATQKAEQEIPPAEETATERVQPVPEMAPEEPVMSAEKASERAEAHSNPVWEEFGTHSVERSYESSEAMAKTAQEIAAGRSANQLSKDELLAAAETIMVDKVPLRKLYEAHNLGEENLRRLIAEHLKGHDIKEMLAHELLEKELHFELDPTLHGQRDLPLGASNTEELKSRYPALYQSQATNRGADGMTPEERAVAVYEQQQVAKAKRARRTLDYLFGAAILLLTFIVLLLLLRRA